MTQDFYDQLAPYYHLLYPNWETSSARQSIGRDGVKQSMSRHLAGFPDLRVTIDDILADGAKVGIWYTVEGTHKGEFEAIPPTGTRVKWEGFDLFVIEDGRIVNARFLSDFHGLLTQLGATLSLPSTPARRHADSLAEGEIER